MPVKFDHSGSNFRYSVAGLPPPCDVDLIPALDAIEAANIPEAAFQAAFGWAQVPILAIDSLVGAAPFYRFVVALNGVNVSVVVRDYGVLYCEAAGV